MKKFLQLTLGLLTAFLFTNCGFSFLQKSTAAKSPQNVVTRLISISPALGTIKGGNVISILGEGFLPDSAVLLGTSPASVIAYSPALLTIVAGSSTTANLVDVTVTAPNGVSSSIKQAFTFASPSGDAPVVTGVSINSGVPAGNQSVTLTGTGFVSGAIINVGPKAGSVQSLTPTEIRFLTPALPEGGFSISETNPDGQQMNLPNVFTVKTPDKLTLSSIDLKSGIASGGTSVTLSGTGFDPKVSVAFGGATATIGTVSSKSISLQTPAHAVGVVDVTVKNPDGSSATLPNLFTYANPTAPAPKITKIEPALGYAGSAITITGTGFSSGAAIVTFAGVALTATSTATQILCTAPASNVTGAVPVVITNTDNQQATVTFKYTAPPPSVSQPLVPNSGNVKGGQTVVINGANFIPGVTVNFGSNGANVVQFSSTQLTVLTPASGDMGAVTLQVINPDGQYTSADNAYTYVDSDVKLTSIDVTSGPVTGGTTVILSGKNFGSGTVIQFGSQTVSGTKVTSTSIQVTSPAVSQLGAVNISVTNPDKSSATLYGSFTYQSVPLTIASLSMTTGSSDGGNSVTVTGTSFTNSTRLTLDTIPVPVTYNSSTQLSFTTPANSYTLPVDVSVYDGAKKFTLAKAFTFVLSPLAVTSITPNKGSINGATIVVAGTGFRSPTSVTVGGGTCNLSAPSYGPPFPSTTTLIECFVGAHAAGSVDVVIKNAEGKSLTVTSGFTFLSTGISLLSVSPANTDSDGQVLTTIYGSGFSAGMVVTVDAQPVLPFNIKGSSFSFYTRPHGVGTANILVTLGSQTSNVLPVTFTDTLAPIIEDVSAPFNAIPGLEQIPTGVAADVGGGDVFTITGTGMKANGTLTVDGVAIAPSKIQLLRGPGAPDYTRASTIVNFQAPPHAAGTAQLVWTNPNGKSTTATANYAPVMLPVDPSFAVGNVYSSTTINKLLIAPDASDEFIAFGSTFYQFGATRPFPYPARFTRAGRNTNLTGWFTGGAAIRIQKTGGINPTFFSGASPLTMVPVIDKAGYLYVADQMNNGAILRMSAQGQIDASFSIPLVGIGAVDGSYVQGIVPMPNGDLAVVMANTLSATSAPTTVVRLNSNRQILNGFPASGGRQDSKSPYLASPSGQLVYASDQDVFALNATGTASKLFTQTCLGAGLTLLAIDSNAGQIYTACNGVVARYSNAGVVDATYKAPAFLTVNLSPLIDGSGKAYVYGSFNGGVAPYSGLLRLNANGSVDTTFKVGAFDPSGEINTLVQLSDGNIVVGGSFVAYAGNGVVAIAGIHADGSFNPAINRFASAAASPNQVLPDKQGRIIATGVGQTFNGTPVSSTVRILANGALDKTFTLPAAIASSGFPYSVAFSSDQSKLYVVSSKIYRINAADGSLDSTFTPYPFTFPTYKNFSMAPGSDNTLYVGSPKSLFQLKSDGTLNANFNVTTPMSDTPMVLPLDDNSGRVIAAASCTATSTESTLVLLNADGKATPGFAHNYRSCVTAGAIIPDGSHRVLVAGSASVSRFLADGTLDPSFAVTGNSGYAESIYPLTDGSGDFIVVWGQYILGQTISGPFFWGANVIRYHSDGTPAKYYLGPDRNAVGNLVLNASQTGFFLYGSQSPLYVKAPPTPPLFLFPLTP